MIFSNREGGRHYDTERTGLTTTSAADIANAMRALARFNNSDAAESEVRPAAVIVPEFLTQGST